MIYIKDLKKSFTIIISFFVILTLGSCADNSDDKRVIAVGWHNRQDSYSFVSTIKTIEETGAIPKVLEMVKANYLEYDENGKLTKAKDENGMLTNEAAELVKKYGYKDSNIESVMKGVKCLILPGGSDISPSLYRDPEPPLVSEDDLDYCAERDVSDYLLTLYCLDNDIPLLAICRGMQMLSIVSGASMIQDIGSWLNEQGITYHDLHRDPFKKDFAAHDVSVIDQESLLYSLMKKDLLENCPSWHHQAVASLAGTSLSVTALTQTDGIEIIEAVERKDKRYIIGIQYHPEVAVRKTVDKETDVNKFMSAEEALVLFKALLAEAY